MAPVGRRRSLLLALPVVVAAAVAAWLLLSGGQHAGDGSAPDTSSMPPADSPDASVDAPAASAPRRKRSSAANDAGAAAQDADPGSDATAVTSVVRTVSDDGSPLPGARVTVVADDGTVRAEALSDGRGEVRFANAVLDGSVVRATATGRACALSNLGEIGEESGEYVLELEAGIAARGRVVSRGTSSPVAGATVRISNGGDGSDVPGAVRWPWTAVTEEDGGFAIDDLCEDVDACRVYVSAPGFARSRIDLDDDERSAVVIADGRADLGTFGLDPAGRLHGTVRTTAGEPVAGAQVTLRSGLDDYDRPADSDDPQAVTTGAAGAFEFDDLRYGWTYTLRAVSEDGGLTGEVTGVSIEEARREASLDVIVSQASQVEFRVTDKDRHPVRGARILMARGDEPTTELATDGDGVAALVGAPSGRYTVYVLADAGAPVLTEVSIGPGDAQHTDVVIEPGWTWSGRLVDDRGRPARGKLTLSVDSTRRLRDFEGRYYFPDADGAFVVDRLGPAIEEIRVERDGDVVLRVPLEGPATDARVVVSSPVHVRFTTELPGPVYISWDAFDSRGYEIGHGYDEQDTSAPVHLYVPPCKRIELSVDGCLPASREIDGQPGADVDLGEVVFVTGRTLSGRVVDPEGRPVVGARVWIWTPETDLVDSVRTGADGGFSVSGVPSVAVRVEVVSPAFLDEEFPVDAASDSCVIRLRRGGLVRARCVGSGGGPVPDAVLSLERSGDDDVATPDESGPGAPLDARVAPGAWRVVVRCDGDERGAADVDVVEGRTHDVVVRLTE